MKCGVEGWGTLLYQVGGEGLSEEVTLKLQPGGEGTSHAGWGIVTDRAEGTARAKALCLCRSLAGSPGRSKSVT